MRILFLPLLAVIVASICLYPAAAVAQRGQPENGEKIYRVPCASVNNAVELTVINGSSRATAGVRIVPVDLPTWVHLSPTERVLQRLAKSGGATARFIFSVDKSAPVSRPCMLRFRISTPGGETWTKDIQMSVAPPERFELFQNFPNPFNPATKIEFTLPESRRVRLVIYDVLGQELQTLINDVEEAGYKSVDFDASRLPSGVYFYSLQAGGFVEVKKMLIAK